ncbi:DUF5362 family protein [Algoriphagus boseongensis]|nr:DUF5362 family protein [Algoriphagus boseongensis]
MEENFTNQSETPQTLTLERPALGFLMETARWGKFMAIVSFVGLGLLVLLGIFYSAFISSLAGGELDELPASISGAVGLVYVLMAVLFFFPVLYLYRFSVKIQSSIRSKTTEEFTHALSNLKSLFKFMGIYTVVILAIYALVLFGVMLGAAFI